MEIAKEKETTKDMAAEYSWTKASLGYIRDAFEILNYLRLHVYQHEQSHVEIKNRLANLDKEIQTTEADFTKSLKAIREWMRTYQPTLDEATKDYADKLGRATQLER
jgi:hypothetical protein